MDPLKERFVKYLVRERARSYRRAAWVGGGAAILTVILYMTEGTRRSGFWQAPIAVGVFIGGLLLVQAIVAFPKSIKRLESRIPVNAAIVQANQLLYSKITNIPTKAPGTVVFSFDPDLNSDARALIALASRIADLIGMTTTDPELNDIVKLISSAIGSIRFERRKLPAAIVGDDRVAYVANLSIA